MATSRSPVNRAGSRMSLTAAMDLQAHRRSDPAPRADVAPLGFARMRQEEQILAAVMDQRLHGNEEAVYYLLRGLGMPATMSPDNFPQIEVFSTKQPALYGALQRIGLRLQGDGRKLVVKSRPSQVESSASDRPGSAPLAATQPLAKRSRAARGQPGKSAHIKMEFPSAANDTTGSGERPATAPKSASESVRLHTSEHESDLVIGTDSRMSAQSSIRQLSAARAHTPSRAEQRRWCSQRAQTKQLVPSRRMLQATVAEAADDLLDEDSCSEITLRSPARTSLLEASRSDVMRPSHLVTLALEQEFFDEAGPKRKLRPRDVKKKARATMRRPTRAADVTQTFSRQLQAAASDLHTLVPPAWIPTSYVDPAVQKQFCEQMSRPRRIAALPTPVRSLTQTAAGKQAQRSLLARLAAGQNQADGAATDGGSGCCTPNLQVVDRSSAGESFVLVDSAASPSALDAASTVSPLGSSSAAALFGRNSLRTQGHDEGEGVVQSSHAATRELAVSSAEAWLEQPPEAFEPEDTADRSVLASALVGTVEDRAEASVVEAWQAPGRSTSLKGRARLAPLAANNGLVGWQLAHECYPWA